MKISPNQAEIDLAADLLVNRYNISLQLLGRLFGVEARDQANEILQEFGAERLDKLKMAKLLILRKGSTLFSGSDDDIKKLRRHLLESLPERKLKQLFEKHVNNRNITSISYMVTPLVEKRWNADGNWPRDFVKALGFPPIFAGVKQRASFETVIDIQPRMPVPKLVDFQVQLKEDMLKVLERDGDKTRCIVTLPTGGGKTRVAVEAFIDWMIPRFAEGKYLIWIAQSEELCEQAIHCIEQMWSCREYLNPLRIYRFFGGREITADDLVGGVVVSSIQQIHSRIKNNDEALENILTNTGAMIIDEAHRAVSAMYDGLLEKAEELCPGLFPICGLTATPGRTGLNNIEETVKLVDRFEAYLIKPELGPEYASDPLRYFRDNKYLAKPKHITFRSGIEYVLTDREKEQVPQDADDLMPPGFLKRLAYDKDRNLMIIRRLLQIPLNKPTIIYACTVEHANFLSVILNEQGRTAGVIFSDTPLTIRRALIKDFKEGNIQFLCNFGVLTTGFDAPLTEYIVICRPTTSEVLYEQIIGRGLRGPAFGGTEECTIIDFADNIQRLGKPLAYARFIDFWTSEVGEESVNTNDLQCSISMVKASTRGL